MLWNILKPNGTDGSFFAQDANSQQKKQTHECEPAKKNRVFQQISTDRWFKQYAKETWDGDYDYEQSNKRKTRDPHKQGLKDLKGFETSANDTCHLGYASKMG